MKVDNCSPTSSSSANSSVIYQIGYHSSINKTVTRLITNDRTLLVMMNGRIIGMNERFETLL
jgi:hypothetical protein